jgi:phosphohistidine phosphatase
VAKSSKAIGLTMHQLLLLRHAKSSRGDATLPDRDRPLNGRGRHAAAAMRAAMRRLGLAPDLILVSPSRRTLQTLEALEPWDDTPLTEHVAVLYLGNAGQLRTLLRGVAETVRSVLLIGHNPGMHDLALELAGDAAQAEPDAVMRRLMEKYPPGALIEFAVAGPWRQLGAGGGRLVRFLTPQELQERAG